MLGSIKKYLYAGVAAIGATLAIYFYYIKSSLSKQKEVNKQLEQYVQREKANVEVVKQVNTTNATISQAIQQAREESKNVQQENQATNTGERPSGKFGDKRLR